MQKNIETETNFWISYINILYSLGEKETFYTRRDENPRHCEEKFETFCTRDFLYWRLFVPLR